jgi:hypothetical protein
MTFLKERKSREMLRITKPSPIVFGLIAAVVVSAGYITALAVLAPQQLAEAAITATDVICDKCIGTSDIADSAVTSAKIGGGQVKNSDIGSNAVTSGKIADGTIVSADMADQAIISTKIADSAVTSSKLAGGAVKPNVHKLEGGNFGIAPGAFGSADLDCPAGEKVTGGGFEVGGTNQVNVVQSEPFDENTWKVSAFNADRVIHSIQPWAVCIGVYP